MATNLQTRGDIECRFHITEEMRQGWDYRHLIKHLMPETEYNEPIEPEEKKVDEDTELR